MAPAKRLSSDDSPVSRGRKRVLLIEDNNDTRLLYKMFLEHGGFIVDEAADGVEGLARALENPPDLVVLDIGLPGLDGFEVARRLRQHPETAALPIIAVSAQLLLGYEELAVNAGCTEALSKPCLASDLLAAVERALAPR